jgi:hypothetical protein
MGMRFSERFANAGRGFADQAAAYEKQGIEQDLRARLEAERVAREGSRDSTLNQMTQNLSPEFLASNPDQAALAQAFMPAFQHEAKYGDPTIGKASNPIYDLLTQKLGSDAAQKRAETAALGQEKTLSARLDKDQRKEYKEKVETVRKFNQDRKEREVSGLGIARTADDAKKLKAAAVLKEDLDNKLAEMKKLREDKGFELFPSAASTRGKQLAEQILLAIKDMAQLGVLSKSDEGILEKIVPRDPTGAGFKMAQIEGLIKDVNDKYEIGVNNRIEQRYEPGQKFQAVEEPKWTGEGESPVPNLELDPKVQEKQRQEFNKKVQESANDPEKFKKLIKPEEVSAWRSDPKNQAVMEAARKVYMRNNNGKAPTEEDIGKFIRTRMVNQKLSQ